ncbi:helix-turn-helix domain-containing protein [Streptomyces millisiae]|uniref:Helix-turn-helix transcriptional regulator n=1 Tax=Streptomyces millisiae TaxID=3075542 RepID=A0ABU2LQN1_9ACTN|nr:helix-turn-helix transcriptional regulator [Streptomyces sp. DSM 44918]MDT0319897.1 helix-turn-helix transcriptional regulator [Streptomyces sp. DSM 44918]
MATPRKPIHFGPTRVGWEFFGAELKRRREDAELTQDDLGRKVFCSGSYIGQFEAAFRKPQLEHAQRFDEIFQTGGLFERMCEELINKAPFAKHFQYAAELQAMATVINEYAPLFIPGLLQTERYARAVFKAVEPFDPAEETEEKVRNRLERGRILQCPTAPVLWTVLGETVLRRPVGGHAVMAEQLRHVAAAARKGRILIQVLPYSSGAQGMLEGSMTLMSFEDAPDVTYVEGPYWGQLLDDPALVARCQRAFDLARAAALPPEQSLELIESLAKEYESHEGQG